ncbi:MAG: folate-binding protein YgfZ [Acidobacteriaceae bacterium]|nr:folate-binding protein YgfZ [Acidobacteriaceae bacterium]
MNGYEALRESAAVVDLSARGKIRVLGDDRARLLHAMSTSNVQELVPGHGSYTFFLNDKGRILADALIYNLGEALFLDLEPETGPKIFQHLDRYIIADDATLEDETAIFSAIGLEGPKSLTTAAQLGIPVGDTRISVRAYGSGFTVRVTASGAEGLRIFVSASENENVTQRLYTAGAIAANAEEVRIVRLENGMPRYGEEISERYLVQETQQTEAVHPNKGCYLGQEIVERVRSRGQVHRLLTPIRIVGSTPPSPGTKLQSRGADVAEISSAVYSPALNEVIGLAYVRTEAAHAKPAMTVAGSEPPVQAFIRSVR